ncbi:DUF2267 domain-containing protein [Sciscionella marina]|uniref:DUF2267 domain-containing protein n=1 Tax=Sciscionella marina TaxID=508770 RepID=UPI0003820246|nr:DUF2267 domain-containing protein [Sciscionella marina]
MKDYEIIAAVRRTVGLSDDEHARNATEATLTVLGQRLAGNEPADLAAQLPPSVAEALPESGGRGTFGLEEFCRRVGDAEGRGCTQDAAREHARAVVAALKAGVSRGEFDDLIAQLPADYRQDLLTTAPIDEQRS